METTATVSETAIANKALALSIELYDVVALLKTALNAMPEISEDSFLDARETIRVATRHLYSLADRVEMIDK